jgi:tetratricopeptide (TPR) repeat protein
MDVGHQPIAAGTESIPWFGGTPAYMSPEQREAMKALSLQKPIPMRVDERSDVYSLGMVLYHALGGKADENVPADPMRLPSLNPQVSKEVAQIIARCVADAPGQRYADCSALAADLDRQLHDLPLRGVPDRVSERWRKWRRRRPLGLPFAVLFVSFCAALSFLGISYQQINLERRAKAEASLLDGQELQRRGQYEAAVRRFHAGQQIAAQTIGADFLKDQLARRLHNAQRLQYAQELNETVRLMRFGALEPRTPRRPSHLLEAASRKVWTRRAHLTDRSAGPLETPLEQTIDNQLQELVLLWSDLQMRLAPVTERDAVQEEVARVIGEAEDQFGTSFAIQLAKDRHGIASTDKPLPPRAAWEYCAVGRAALADGKLARAHADFIKALELEPLNPVANYYAGVVDLREKRYADALQKLSLCLGADPVPECFVFRGEAYAALAQHELALRDFQQAIDRQADFAPAYEQRGQLCQKLGRHEESKKDLERARQLNQ